MGQYEWEAQDERPNDSNCGDSGGGFIGSLGDGCLTCGSFAWPFGSGPGGGSGGPSQPPRRPILGPTRFEGPCEGSNRKLVDLGNEIAAQAAWISKLGNYEEGIGLTLLFAGSVTGAEPVALGGAALTRVGAYTGIAAGGLQLFAGVAQGLGGAGYSNAVNAVGTIAIGSLLGYGLVGPSPTGYLSRVQRMAERARVTRGLVIGATYDLVTSLPAGIGPQQLSCPAP